MLSIKYLGSLSGGVYQQYTLGWKPSPDAWAKECVLSVWVAGCCGFNTLSIAQTVCSDLSEQEFEAFLKEVSRVFKARDFGTLFQGMSSPPYPIRQVFFLYGDTFNQRDCYKPLISRGKEVHRYRSGSEPDHDTVLISIDL
jgi:hypothetical protein